MSNESPMKFLSLFSGIGGFDLGLERVGMQCVGQVEIDKFCIKVLEKHWPHVKRMEDIRDVKGTEFGTVDLICGGVPCQPASTAGKRKGTADDRWLWPETFRIVRAIKPTWCLFENVRGLISLEQGVVFNSLLSELEGIGYEVQTFIIPACAVNAPHRRDRVWIIAYSESWRIGGRGIHTNNQNGEREDFSAIKNNGNEIRSSVGTDNAEGLRNRIITDPRINKPRRLSGIKRETISAIRKTNCAFGNPKSTRQQGGIIRPWEMQYGGTSTGYDWIEVATRLCRVDDGLPNRVDRLKSLGNAVVPQIVEVIGRAIIFSRGTND